MVDRDILESIDNGDGLNKGYYNGIYGLVQVIGSVYTGTDFDDGANHTIQISSGDISQAAFLVANFTINSRSRSSGVSTTGQTTIQIERNETGQSSWSDVLAITIISASSTNAVGDGDTDRTVGTISIPITLTAGEKTNGIDIKITTVVTGTGHLRNITTYFTGLL